MKSALMSSACALGIISFALVGCSRKTNDRGEPQGQTPSATEQQRAEDQRKADEQRAEDQRKADEQRKEAERRSIGGGPAEKMDPSAGLASIAAARCDREARCNNVGPNAKYKTRGDCVADVLKDKRDDFSVASCPAVSRKKLEGCIQEIREERCGSPFDWFNRMELCRSGSLCEK
jgi:hypothetical protein